MSVDHLPILNEAVEDIVNGHKTDQSYIQLTLYFLLQEILHRSEQDVTSLSTVEDLFRILFRYNQNLINKDKRSRGKKNLLRNVPRMQIKDRISIYIIQGMGLRISGRNSPIVLTPAEQKQLEQIRADARKRMIQEQNLAQQYHYLDYTSTSIRVGSETWELANRLYMRVG